MSGNFSRPSTERSTVGQIIQIMNSAHGATQKKPVVLAPTGVAALNVKGQTIHKFFHFYIDVTPDKIRKKQTKPRNPKLYKKIKTIIIDEVSMVRADLLDCMFRRRE